MNLRNLSTAIATGLTLACGSAFANEPLADPILDPMADKANVFSYNYAEVSYVSLDGNFDGFKFAGSYDVTKNLGVAASYMTTSASSFFGDVDLDILSVDAIYHFQFDKFSHIEQLKSMDLVLHVGIENGETGIGAFSIDDTGLRFGAKARVQLTPQVEAFADVSYTTIFDGDLVITGGGVYSINEQISVFASYELSDLSTLSIGGRFSF